MTETELAEIADMFERAAEAKRRRTPALTLDDVEALRQAWGKGKPAR